MLVEDPAQQFGVTPQTIRRDVGELADAGQLERVRGGAMHKAGFATLSELDAVFTDQPLPRSLAASCADWNTWVALAI